jgi:hypothetical protein
MMSDREILPRLESAAEFLTGLPANALGPACLEAAAEITRLRALVAELESQVKSRDAIFDDLDHVYKTLHADHQDLCALVVAKNEALRVFASDRSWRFEKADPENFEYTRLYDEWVWDNDTIPGPITFAKDAHDKE